MKKLMSAREAAAGELVATLEVEDVEVGAQVPVGLELEALGLEVTRGAPAAALDVLGLVNAHGRGLARDVGQVGHEVIEVGLELAAALGKAVDLLVDLADGLLGSLGLVLLALLHEGANLLGLGVARGLELLDLADDGTALVVELEELLAVPARLAVGHGLVDGVRVFADKLHVEHGCSLSLLSHGAGYPARLPKARGHVPPAPSEPEARRMY